MQEADYTDWDRTIQSGWGKVEGGEIMLKEPRPLRKVSLTIIGDKECIEYVSLLSILWLKVLIQFHWSSLTLVNKPFTKG